jgi:hypothetical protein
MNEFRLYIHVHCQNWFQSVKFFLTPESMNHVVCIPRKSSVSLSHKKKKKTYCCSSKKEKIVTAIQNKTAVYFENHMEQTNILREQTSEFFNVKKVLHVFLFHLLRGFGPLSGYGLSDCHSFEAT